MTFRLFFHFANIICLGLIFLVININFSYAEGEDNPLKKETTNLDLLLEELKQSDVKIEDISNSDQISPIQSFPAPEEQVEDKEEEEVKQNQDSVELIILNKITAKSTRSIFNVGQTKEFGNISIKAHKCVKNTDPFNINSFILLTISDLKKEDDESVIYHGWLASSNLSISTVEHNVYEVIAVNCFINNSDNTQK